MMGFQDSRILLYQGRNADTLRGTEGKVGCRSPLFWIDHLTCQHLPIGCLPREHLAELLLIDDSSQTQRRSPLPTHLVG